MPLGLGEIGHNVSRSLAYAVESAKIRVQQAFIHRRYTQALLRRKQEDTITSGFNMNLVAGQLTKEQLIDIIYYNYTGLHPGKFIIRGDILYGDIRPYGLEDAKSMEDAEWYILVNPDGRSYIVLSHQEKIIGFNKNGLIGAKTHRKGDKLPVEFNPSDLDPTIHIIPSTNSEEEITKIFATRFSL